MGGRNLHLAKEGLILADTPAAKGATPKDLAKRLRDWQVISVNMECICNFFFVSFSENKFTTENETLLQHTRHYFWDDL